MTQQNDLSFKEFFQQNIQKQQQMHLQKLKKKKTDLL